MGRAPCRRRGRDPALHLPLGCPPLPGFLLNALWMLVGRSGRCASAWGRSGRRRGLPRGATQVWCRCACLVWTLLLIPGGWQQDMWSDTCWLPRWAHRRRSARITATSATCSSWRYRSPRRCLVRAFLSGLRDELPPVRFGLLALAQMVLFLSVELLEHSSAGIGAATLTEPAVLCGLPPNSSWPGSSSWSCAPRIRWV